MPVIWWVSRLCEEFHCLPSQAWREYQNLPSGIIEEILEARQYVSVRNAYEQATDTAKLPQSEMLDLVREIDFSLAQEDGLV